MVPMTAYFTPYKVFVYIMHIFIFYLSLISFTVMFYYSLVYVAVAGISSNLSVKLVQDGDCDHVMMAEVTDMVDKAVSTESDLVEKVSEKLK